MAKREAAELQALALKEGGNFPVESWDWWFYAERLKKAKYELDSLLKRRGLLPVAATTDPGAK